jgi:hypothetical protein
MISGLYYRHFAIVNDDSGVVRMMLQAVTPPPNVILTTLGGGGIYGPREYLQYRGHLRSSLTIVKIFFIILVTDSIATQFYNTDKKFPQ